VGKYQASLVKHLFFFEVSSHNIAFDKPVFDFDSPEWQEGRREHKYYARGIIASDIIREGVNAQRFVTLNRERNRYKDIQAKRQRALNGMWKEDFKKYSDEGYDYFGGLFTSQIGHKIFGALLPVDDFYFGFELYGEPWESWSKTDLYDDTKFKRWLFDNPNPPQFYPPYWFR